MTVKDLIFALLNTCPLDAEVEVEFDKTKIPDDNYKYCQLTINDVTGYDPCTLDAEVI